jgi:nicotinamidase-related amidase
MSAALLLTDYQEAMCRADGIIGGPSGMGAEVERRDVLAAASRCLEAARHAGLTVAHSRVVFDEDFSLRTNRSATFAQMGGALVEGSPHVAFCPEVAPRQHEPVIVRQWVDPFVGSPLDGLLRGKGVSTLYVGGVTTNHVVESSARHAADLGYEVFVIDDLCSSVTAEMHEFALSVLPVWAEVISEQAFIERIAA